MSRDTSQSLSTHEEEEEEEEGELGFEFHAHGQPWELGGRSWKSKPLPSSFLPHGGTEDRGEGPSPSLGISLFSWK